jgi:hypothetical protein
MTTLSALKSALSALEQLDSLALVSSFREFEHGCSAGTYCALVLDPSNGSTSNVNEASWSCSADEYFSESGVLSRQTLCSSTRAHWSPSPDDGFEWIAGTDYVHPEGDPSAWITSESFAALAPEFSEKFTEWFSVSDTPVEGWAQDGWDDPAVDEVNKQLALLKEAITDEIERQEAEVVA